MSKLKKFLILSADDIAIALIIIGLAFLFFPEFFLLIATIIIVGLLIFLIIKYVLIVPVIGEERKEFDIIGKEGVVIKEINGEGIILIHGERWKARSLNGRKIPVGKKVKVVNRVNLTAIVREIANET